MNRVSFLATLACARRGERVQYHSGLLMYDRQHGPFFQNVHAIAHAAWEAFEAGRCTLVQHRINPTVCDYYAVKL